MDRDFECPWVFWRVRIRLEAAGVVCGLGQGPGARRKEPWKSKKSRSELRRYVGAHARGVVPEIPRSREAWRERRSRDCRVLWNLERSCDGRVWKRQVGRRSLELLERPLMLELVDCKDFEEQRAFGEERLGFANSFRGVMVSWSRGSFVTGTCALALASERSTEA